MIEQLDSSQRPAEAQLDPETVDTAAEEVILDQFQIGDAREIIEEIHEAKEDEAATQAAATAEPEPIAHGPTKIIIRKLSN